MIKDMLNILNFLYIQPYDSVEYEKGKYIITYKNRDKILTLFFYEERILIDIDGDVECIPFNSNWYEYINTTIKDFMEEVV